MKRRGILALTMVIGSVTLTSVTFYIWQVLRTPNVLVDQQPRILTISSGATYEDVMDELIDGNYVGDPISFGVVAKAMKYHDNVKPGRYELLPNLNNTEAVRLLRSGEQKPVKITFNNVRLPEELAKRITHSIELTEADFLSHYREPAVAEQYGLSSETLPCMFLANTYEVYWNMSEKALFDRMNSEYEKFWNEDRRAKATALNLTPTEVATLASIVKEENLANPEEWPKIARMYLNRLSKGMRLQADPTLKFAVGDFTIKRVLNTHKEVTSPYNTYQNPGLPPGPINFVNGRVIDAVLNADEHNYLYMCAKPGDSNLHAFASSLTKHNINAQRYHRWLNAQGIYR